MLATERLQGECLFHDLQAQERAVFFDRHRNRLVFQDPEYLDHEPWIRPAFELLGCLEGKTVLDAGCGHGMASVVLARRGAQVIGCDLSPRYIEEARARAAANGVQARFQVAEIENLPFPDASFDAVWGCAILHHLDLARAGREIQRVLRPGGVAVFCEPWGGNRLLEFARRWLPYPGKNRTPDERPLTAADLPALRALFPTIQVRGFQLLGMARRAFTRTPRAGGRLDCWDAIILRRFPFLENWCRYVVLALRQP